MRRKSLGGLVLGFILLVSFSVRAQEEEREILRVKLNYWNAFYTGTVKLEDTDRLGGTPVNIGESLDLDKDLGLENPQGIPELEFQLRLGANHRVLMSYFSVDYEGEETLSEEVEFAGYKFRLGTDFGTEMQFSRLRLLHAWTPWRSELGNVAFMWGTDYYWWTVGYEGIETTAGRKIEQDESLPLPIPVMGIAGEVNFGAGFGAYGSIHGIGVNWFDFQASYVEYNLGLSWEWQYLYAAAGYRSTNTILRAEDLDPELNMRLQHAGWFASVGAQF